MSALHQENAFWSDLLAKIGERGRQLLGRPPANGAASPARINELAASLISTKGEASGVALARAMVEQWRSMDGSARSAWFDILAEQFGPDKEELAAAVEAWQAGPTPEAAQRLHDAAESLRQELLRRINLAPGGTAAVVDMRAVLLGLMKTRPELAAVDADFVHLLASWFNRGFLLLRPIDWSSPADILEKIIHYEAVHEIKDWNDLRRRLKPQDRRCFAFFHPQMPQEPLIFVEIALTSGIPGNIGELLREERAAIDPRTADTAVFYSISNTQAGLKGVSFGNFLIKQVVEELLREMPWLKNFVTLSPLPGFAQWLEARRADGAEAIGSLKGFDRLAELDRADWQEDAETRQALGPVLEQAAAVYLVRAKGASRRPIDPVARFHLGNGARLERIHASGDLSPKGLSQSHGVMVNYLYDPRAIEKNHEIYADGGDVVHSSAVRKILASDTSVAIARNVQNLLSPEKPRKKKEVKSR
ncbi:MAG: malonyl-CoA decarboxylase [Parvibaculaceae bacterium]